MNIVLGGRACEVITEEEARELVNLFNVTVNASNKFYHKSSAHLQIVEAAEKVRGKLGDFAIQELARRESERIERSKPITPDWCLSRGAKHWEAGDEYVFECGVRWTSIGVYYDHRGRDPWRHVTALPEIKTCGQLSDLLNALKGGES